MRKVKLFYQTTLYYEEVIDVPDEMFVSDEDLGDALNDEGWEYLTARATFIDETDCYTEFTDAEILNS